MASSNRSGTTVEPSQADPGEQIIRMKLVIVLQQGHGLVKMAESFHDDRQVVQQVRRVRGDFQKPALVSAPPRADALGE